MKNQKGFAVVSTVFIIILVFAGVYYLYMNNPDFAAELKEMKFLQQ